MSVSRWVSITTAVAIVVAVMAVAVRINGVPPLSRHEGIDFWPVREHQTWTDAAMRCNGASFDGHLAFSNGSNGGPLMVSVLRAGERALGIDPSNALIWTGLRVRRPRDGNGTTSGSMAHEWHGGWDLPMWDYMEPSFVAKEASGDWMCVAVSVRPIPDRTSGAPPYGYARLMPCDTQLPSLCMRVRRGLAADAPFSGSSHTCGGVGRGQCSILRRVEVVPDTGDYAHICECRCSDSARYSGYACDTAMCFGAADDEDGVCSGHGTCIGPDECRCDVGYGGPDCSAALCANQLATDPGVCSGRGSCVAPNRCKCDDPAAWSGSTCAIPHCYGRNATDVNVCSGGGRCVAPDTCLCVADQFVGRDCEHTVCHRRSTAQEDLVCGGPERGECVAPDTCICRNGYMGPTCEEFRCHGLERRNVSHVCSGNGRCVAPDTCTCSPGWSGADCSVFHEVANRENGEFGSVHFERGADMHSVLHASSSGTAVAAARETSNAPPLPSQEIDVLNHPDGLRLNGTDVLLENVIVNGAGHVIDGRSVTIRSVIWRRPAHLRHVPLLRISPYARHILFEDCTFEDELPGSGAAPGIMWQACGSVVCMQNTTRSTGAFVVDVPGGECAPGEGETCSPDVPGAYAYNFVVRGSRFGIGERAISLTYGRGALQDDPYGDGGDAVRAECHVPDDDPNTGATWSTFYNATLCDAPVFCDAPDEPVGCTNMTEYEPPAAPPAPSAMHTAYRHRILVRDSVFHAVHRDAIFIGREPLRTTEVQEDERALFVSSDICRRNYTCAGIEHVHIVDSVFHAEHDIDANVGPIVNVALDDPSAYVTEDAYLCSGSRVRLVAPGVLSHEVQTECQSGASTAEEPHAVRQVRIARNHIHGARSACIHIHARVMRTLVSDNVCELAGPIMRDSRPLADALRILPHVTFGEGDPGDLESEFPEIVHDAQYGAFIVDMRAFMDAVRVERIIEEAIEEDIESGIPYIPPVTLNETRYESNRVLTSLEDAVIVQILRNDVRPTGICASALEHAPSEPVVAIGSPPQTTTCIASCGECGAAAHVWQWSHVVDYFDAASNVIRAPGGHDAELLDPDGLYGAFSYGAAMHIDSYADARRLLVDTYGVDGYDTSRASASAVRSHELHMEAWNFRARNPSLAGRGADVLIVARNPSGNDTAPYEDYEDGAPRRPDWPARAAACAGSCKGPRCSERCEVDASRVRASAFDRCYGVTRFDTLAAALADCMYEELALLPVRYPEEPGRLLIAPRRLSVFTAPDLAAPPGPLPHQPPGDAGRAAIEHGIAPPPQTPPDGEPLHPIRLHGADVTFDTIDFWLGADATDLAADDYRASLFARDAGAVSTATSLIDRIELRHCNVRTVAPAGDAAFDTDNMRMVFSREDFIGVVNVLRFHNVTFDGTNRITVDDPQYLDVYRVTARRAFDGVLIAAPARGFKIVNLYAAEDVRPVLGGGSAVNFLSDSDCSRGCLLEDSHAEGPLDPSAAIDIPQPSESEFGANALFRLRNIASASVPAAGITGGGLAYGIFYEAMPHVPCAPEPLRELRAANRNVSGVIASVACRAGDASTGPPAHLCRDWCLPPGPPPAWCTVDPASCDPHSDAHGDTCFRTLRDALRFCRASPSVRIAVAPGVYDERGGSPLRLGRSEFMTPDVTGAQREIVVSSVSGMGDIDAWLDGGTETPHVHGDEASDYPHADERHACDDGSGQRPEREVVIVGTGHVLAAGDMDRVVLRGVEFTDAHGAYPDAPVRPPDPERADDQLFAGTARSLIVWGCTLRGSLEPVGAAPPAPTPDPTPPLRPRLSTLASIQLSAGPVWLGGSSLLGARRMALDLHMGGPVDGEAVVVGSCGADVWGRWLAVTGATRARLLGNRCVHACGAVSDAASDGFESLMFISMRRFPVPAQAIAAGLRAVIVARDNTAAVGPDPAKQTRRYVRLGASTSGHTAALMFVNVDDIPPPFEDTIERVAVRGNTFTGYAVGVRLVAFSDTRLVLNEPAGHAPLFESDARRGMRELQRLNGQAISGLAFDVKRGVPALDRWHDEFSFCNGLCLPATPGGGDGGVPPHCEVSDAFDPQTTLHYGAMRFRTLAEGIADCIYEPAVLELIVSGAAPHVESVVFPGGRSVAVRGRRAPGAAPPAVVLQGAHTFGPDLPGDANHLRSVTLSGITLRPPANQPDADILRQADTGVALRSHVTLDDVAVEAGDGGAALRLGRVDARAKVRVLESRIAGRGQPDAALIDVTFETDPADGGGRCAGPGEFEMRDTHITLPNDDDGSGSGSGSSEPHPGALWVAGARRTFLRGGAVGRCGNHTDALRPACVHISPCHVDTFPSGARHYDPDAATVVSFAVAGVGPSTYPPSTASAYAVGGTYTSNPPDTPAHVEPPANVQRTLLWIDVPHMAWCESPAGDFAYDYGDAAGDPDACPQRPAAAANCTTPAAVRGLRRIVATDHPGVALRINGWRVPAGCLNATTSQGDYRSAVRAVSAANPAARGGFSDVVIGVGDDLIASDPQSVRAHHCSDGCPPMKAGLTPWDVVLLAFVVLLIALQLGWFLACGGIQWSLEPLGGAEGGARMSDILARTSGGARPGVQTSAAAATLGRPGSALIGSHVLRPRRRVGG